ncbi:MAG: hypothetical protein WBK55_06755 [Alphaproteobacteria bacterium]
MKLANIFPKQALAPVLTAALSLASIFSPSTGNAEQPARATTISTTAPTNVSIPSNRDPRTAPGSPVQKQLHEAYDHSNTGPSIMIWLNEKEDPAKYVKDIKAIKAVAARENVPLKVFGFTTTDPSYAYILVDEMPFKKQPEGERNFYMNELPELGATALVVYGQSQEYKIKHGVKTSAVASAPDIASNIR